MRRMHVIVLGAAALIQVAGAQTVKWSWPLSVENNKGCTFGGLGKYGDCLQAYQSCVDYMGGRLAYSSHRKNSNDIDLYSFRQMEKGVAVLAVGDAEVTGAEGSLPFDHGGAGGGYYKIFIKLTDGQGVWHAHTRHLSHMAKKGDKVKRGDPLCFVGASGMGGNCALPHLHIEGPRDPFTPGNKLWIDEPPYPGTMPPVVIGLNIYTGDAPRTCYLDDRHGPAVVGRNESTITVMVSFMSYIAEDKVIVRLRKPDGTVFWTKTASSTGRNRQRHTWEVGWSIGDGDRGTWTLEAIPEKGSFAKTKDFRVGATSLYAPRFWCPNNEEDTEHYVRGRSFLISGQSQRYPLRVNSLGGEGVSYRLVNAPSHFSLEDGNTLVIPAGQPSSYTKRNTLFQAIATNAASLADTLFVHTVDFSRAYNNPFDDTAVAAMYDGAPGSTGIAPPQRPFISSRVAGSSSRALFGIDGRRLRPETAAHHAGVVIVHGRGATGSEGPAVLRTVTVP